ncbi:small G protein signaling modulator 1-like isoform X2 [Actinia tenebrosa]|uniref:Small G protein signaling modulator 1-like isoform X2 n=1 Tax=Actinia tenebrosa TaxID=6105 RepID=A0A6P8HL27_ACTTE|nr:small G protein signaling modulator 1-like isoform X2 [Actinia tenebrosa]
MAPQTDEETRQRLLENLKREVKQIMEEAVMKKFIHADSSTITSVCAAVEAGISHGLKKRAGGLLSAHDTQTVLNKLTKFSEPAAELMRKLTGEDEHGKQDGTKSPGGGENPKTKFSWTTSTNVTTKKISGYNVTGHCGKYMWIRIALLEKLLVKIIQDLKTNASQFYEPDALLADPADGQIFIELLEGPCALDFSKMKTPDSFWTDPTADELVQRHKIHSSLYSTSGAASPTTQRPHIGTIKLNQEENPAVAPVMAREHIESLHQNSYTTLLYGKNNVNVQPNEMVSPIPGYLSLHKNNETLVLKWTPNTLMSGCDEKEKSLFWDHALTVNLSDVVYLHCHQQASSGVVILIGQDGVQRPPIHFPTPGSLLSFLNCLENGLHPNGQLDPPLFSPRSRSMVLPRLKRVGDGSAPSSPTKEFSNQDYVFRLVSGTKPEDIVSKEMEKLGTSKRSVKKPGIPISKQDIVSSRKANFSRRLQKQSSPPTRQSLHMACETMKRQFLLRAFNGWCAYVRHLKTVRTHLSFLVSHETIQDKEKDHCYTNGITPEFWHSLNVNGKVTDESLVKKYTYFGGVDNSIRKEVWPYLLNHYKFGSTPEERQKADQDNNTDYRQTLEDWKAVEACILRNDKEHEIDGVSMGSTGSRDEVYEHLEMISTGLEKVGSFEQKRGSIEEPAVEGLDEEAKQRLMSGQDLSLTTNGDDVESGCCDCGEDIGKLSHTFVCRGCGKRFTSELNGNVNNGPLTNGHDGEYMVNGGGRHGKEGTSDGESDDSSLCKQCSQDSSTSSGPYSAELLENFGMNLHRIDKDVQRCDRSHWYFTRENLKKLRNVISSYVWKTLDIGYVQGMCDLVAPLLVVFDDEAKTYSCFVHLMQRMNENFPHGGAMDLHFANMRSLIQVLDPEMFDHLQTNGDLTHFYFCYRWFLLDFKRELLYEDIFVVWETIWAAMYCSTDHFVLFIALALLQFYRDIILDNKMDFTDIIKFFNEMAERHDAKTALTVARSLVIKVQDLIRNQ